MVRFVTPRLLAERYRLVQAIGKGGMGTVWLGHDETLDRRVAVKEVRVPDGLDPAERAALIERQLREARICARLNHPAIVTVHDVIQEDGRPWVVMELIDGRGLNSVVSEDGPMPLEQVADIGVQALDALRHAHAAGVLHRDIKPSNIMLRADGQAILTDFGIATLEGDSRLTQEGGLIGTPGYLAPEQLSERTARPESDLWALGATLYYIAEGRPAYDRETPTATALAPATSDPDAPDRSLPLWPLLSELLDRDPSARPSSDEAMARLAEFDPTARHAPQPDATNAMAAGGYPSPPYDTPYPVVTGGPPTPPGGSWQAAPPPPPPPPSRGRGAPFAFIVGGSAVIFLVLLVVGAAFVVSNLGAGDSPEEPPPTETDQAPQATAPEAPPCETAETSAMRDLAPAAELDEDTANEYDTWSERYCEWRTTATNGDVDTYVSLQLIRSEDTGWDTGAEAAARDLDQEVQDYGGEPVDGVGDEAASWYDDLNSVGCVGTRSDNVYLRVCYDAARSADTTESIPVNEAVTAATDLAAAAVDRLNEEAD
ncbi:serine/threonine protein kinase [Spiractinospora alimapuensis]|uniref:serine/threonine-protein kinase n=1 Tax=Spiractinospora alimapuensis TaxID=2820884 RepID=UPI001F2D90FA|nr:serine/threonine-protein kinase [Spiractinospora alimapuensis]QVQ53946.1 serine/threonine protein kinase [Spiractinospora alimapuensis]